MSVERSKLSSVWSGLLLAGLGVAMCTVALTGDSLYYVRDSMTVPLLVAGAIVVALGLSARVGGGSTHRAPVSLWGVVLAIGFLLVVRPGPLSVDTGFRYDFDQGVRVQSKVVIPTSAIVGEGASPQRVSDGAVELNAGQFRSAVSQFPDDFSRVAVRMIGQVDIDEDGNATLVRFYITCCAADALRYEVALDDPGVAERGDWVEMTGQWNGDEDEPGLIVATIEEIDVPDRPYLTIRDV